jgi:hypothetical protein
VEGTGWRSTFYTTGMEHSPTSATGTAWERTPWHATQRAAWEALRKSEGVRLERVSDGEGDCQSGCNIPFSSNNELKPERRLLVPQNKRAAGGS